MSDKPIVLLFIKAPIKGQVKSRLAADVGEEATLELYKNFVLDSIETVEKSAYPFRICFYPPEGEEIVTAWLGRQYPYLMQEGNDLGLRMGNAFGHIFWEGFTSALLIGSDIPDLPSAVIRSAFESLKENDVVIGPAADGGYYLIGFNNNSFLPRIFQGIAWSTNTVVQTTLDILKGASLRVHIAPEWKDVDTLGDLRALYERNRDTAFDKSRTMTYLIKHRERLFRKSRSYDKTEETDAPAHPILCDDHSAPLLLPGQGPDL
jgi:rSAM/selenodomain-associated transferase 1